MELKGQIAGHAINRPMGKVESSGSRIDDPEAQPQESVNASRNNPVDQQL
jgi:hypothetical protein